MASASSRMISLKLARAAVSPALGMEENICLVPTIVSLCSVGEVWSHTRERPNLFTDNVYPSVITGVQLEDHLPHVLVAIYPPREG